MLSSSQEFLHQNIGRKLDLCPQEIHPPGPPSAKINFPFKNFILTLHHQIKLSPFWLFGRAKQKKGRFLVGPFIWMGDEEMRREVVL